MPLRELQSLWGSRRRESEYAPSSDSIPIVIGATNDRLECAPAPPGPTRSGLAGFYSRHTESPLPSGSADRQLFRPAEWRAQPDPTMPDRYTRELGPAIDRTARSALCRPAQKKS